MTYFNHASCMADPIIPASNGQKHLSVVPSLAALYPLAFAMAAASNSCSGLALRRFQKARSTLLNDRPTAQAPQRQIACSH